jgi:PAS domain S-box-containing protein
LSSGEQQHRRRSDDPGAHSESELPDLFYQVLNFVPEAVLEVDARGVIVFANSRVEEIFGYRPSELLNSAVEVPIPRELQTLHAEKRLAYSERPKNREMGSSMELSGLRKDGTRFAADVSLNPTRSESHPKDHTFAFVRDVTHLRRMEIAERELLDKTLLGIVMTLNSLMSMTSPLIFNRTQSIRTLVSHMAQGLSSTEIWQYELAAALCLIGCTTVPPDVFEKSWAGGSLTKEEEGVFSSHPVIAEKLLAPIQRLEGVAEIVGRQQTIAASGSRTIDLGVGLIQLAQHADRLLYQNTPLPSILQKVRFRHPQYCEEFLHALASYVPPSAVFQIKALRISELQSGMIVEEDLRTNSGLLIAPGETKISPILLERIGNFARTAGIHEPIRVRCPA